MKQLIVFPVVAAVLLVALPAGEVNAISRRHRHAEFSLSHRSQLELRLGVRDDTHIEDDYYIGAVSSRNSIGDLLVNVGYNYFADERTAINLSVRVLASEFEEGIGPLGVYEYNVAVVPIFIGFRHYLGSPGYGGPVRPYLALAGGPVVGSQRLSLVGYEVVDETRTLAAMGAHIGGGIDFIAGRHLMFGINAGYNLLSDFDEPVGGHVNYSGAEFAAGVGFVF